jgi:hypothetical protein
MFVTLLLSFVNMGPLNAALVNVLPPDLRARGFGLHTTTIHLLGDALSPFLIGVVSDSIGLRIPVLLTGLLLPVWPAWCCLSAGDIWWPTWRPASRQAGYVVMIGLCLDGRPALGVLAHPITGTLWSGVVGQAAWRDQADGTRIPVRTSTLAEPVGVRIVVSQSRRSPQIDAFRRALGVTDEMTIGSVGMKVALVSQGERDLYLYPGEQTKLWDTCGPEAILVAAGGRMSDMDGQPLIYDKADLSNRGGVIASNGPLHDHVIRALAAARGKST